VKAREHRYVDALAITARGLRMSMKVAFEFAQLVAHLNSPN